MRFANYVLRCATEKDAIQDERLIRFFAVVILSFLCVLHFRSARMARLLNRAFTAFKVAILFFVVFISGSVKAVHEPKPWSDSSSINSSSTAAAFLLILFSFSGWENATFVSTLDRNPSHGLNP
jgi:amino acid transporter